MYTLSNLCVINFQKSLTTQFELSFLFSSVVENQNGNFIRSNYVISRRKVGKFTQSRLLISCNTGRTLLRHMDKEAESLDEVSWAGQNKLER